MTAAAAPLAWRRRATAFATPRQRRPPPASPREPRARATRLDTPPPGRRQDHAPDGRREEVGRPTLPERRRGGRSTHTNGHARQDAAHACRQRSATEGPLRRTRHVGREQSRWPQRRGRTARGSHRARSPRAGRDGAAPGRSLRREPSGCPPVGYGALWSRRAGFAPGPPPNRPGRRQPRQPVGSRRRTTPRKARKYGATPDEHPARSRRAPVQLALSHLTSSLLARWDPRSEESRRVRSVTPA
jgi:hypothetical protein